jgi:hypothetical protein
MRQTVIHYVKLHVSFYENICSEIFNMIDYMESHSSYSKKQGHMSVAFH